MTRNNLADQVAWLLRNTSLSRPTILSFPNNSDPSSSGLSQTSSRNFVQDSVANRQSGLESQSLSSSDTISQPLYPTLPSARSLTATRHAITPGEPLEEGIMGRLTSASKSKKPSLVSRQQLSSASQTRETRNPAVHIHDDVTLSTATPTPRRPRQQASGVVSSSRRIASPAFSSEFPDLDTEEWECMDLTKDNAPSSESLKFGDDVRLWREDDALRPEPLPKPSSRKRKSDGITKDEEDEEMKDDFPDVYELLGTKPPPATPASRASKRQRDVHSGLKSSRLRDTKQGSRRRAATIDPPESEIEKLSDQNSSPLGRKSRALPRALSQRTPPKPTPPSSREVLQTTDKTSRSHTHVSQQDNDDEKIFSEIHDEMIIPDSDDEFLTPPSRNTSLLLPKDREELAGPVESAALGNGTGSSSAGSGAHVPSTGTAAEDDSISGSLSLIRHLAADPNALNDMLSRVAMLLQRNGQKFMEAINGRAKKERRDEIKAEKEKLLEQQETLKGLSEPLQAYQRLYNEREVVARQVTESYANGVDTDMDELQLDKLTDDIQKAEQILTQRMAQADMNQAILPSAPGTPLTNGTAEPGSTVVIGTQPLDHFNVNMAANSRSSSLSIEPAAEIVRQTQLPAQSKLWNQPIPPRTTASQGQLVSQDDQRLAEPPFPRQSFTPGRANGAGHGVGDRTHMDLVNFDAEFGAVQNLLSDDEDDVKPISRSHRKSRPVSSMHSTQKNRHRRAGEDFSDFSDDEEMLAFAQDYETQQSLRPGSQASRRVLSETTGNSGLVPKPKASASASASTSTKQLKSAVPDLSIPSELMRHPWSPEVQKMLKERFRMKGFRQNQLEAINATLAGEDAFVLMPTGGGKSLCYQLPAVIKSGKTRGVTIVVSPLLSLMQDQVYHMQALGIQAVAFNSECSAQYKREVMSAFHERSPEHFVELLYVTPEMINRSPPFNDAMDTLYRKRKFARLVIDEAHCVSQWGHDFRPDYKTIGQLRVRFPEVPIMALTATATRNVIVDIKHNLGLSNCQVFSQSFNRPNLYYEVRTKSNNSDATRQIADLIKEKYRGVSGIVYTVSRKQAEEVAATLSNDYGITADHYHAGIDPKEKIEVQSGWQKGSIQVVVATIAFGMGIDKPDVRFVAHHGVPKSLEGYYQETGRAGRDGKPSDCILFYGKGDIRVLKKLIQDGDGSPEQKERQMAMLNRVTAFCDNQEDCRRTEVLRYFGEDFDDSQCNKTCDNCKAGLVFEQKDYSDVAKSALQVIKAQRRLTSTQCADILLGKAYPNNVSQNSDEWRGTAKGMPKHEVVRVIDKLFSEKALDEYNQVSRWGVAIQYLQMGPAARLFLGGQKKLMLSVQVSSKAKYQDTIKPKSRKSKKQDKANNAPDMQSTYVSSPINDRKGKGRNRVVADDEETFAQTPNRYANDGFVVSDDAEEDDDGNDDAFDELPAHRPARPASKKTAGTAISVDQRLRSLPDLHQDMVDNFVNEAQKLEEQIRNKKELRRPLFTVQDFRAMAIDWTTSLEKMSRIPGIQTDKVKEFGPRVLTILRRYHDHYMEMMPADGEAPASGTGHDQDIVDLISSDIEFEDDEDSHYFNNRSNTTAQSEVQAFHSRLQSLATASAESSSSRSRASSSRGGGGAAGGGGGKKGYGKKVFRKGSGSFPKRRGGGSTGGGSRKASGSSATSRPSGSAPKRDGKIVKKSGGGIGLMPL